MVEFGWPFGAPIARVPIVMRIGSAPGVGLLLTKVPVNERMLLPDSLLASVRAPTYFHWGDQDPYGGEATARRFIQPIPNAELQMVPGAGHAVWMDDAPLAAAVTRRFLSEQPTRAAG